VAVAAIIGTVLILLIQAPVEDQVAGVAEIQTYSTVVQGEVLALRVKVMAEEQGRIQEPIQVVHWVVEVVVQVEVVTTVINFIMKADKEVLVLPMLYYLACLMDHTTAVQGHT
jgi:hypothetical protein